jgi:hypothetical protein
LDDDAVNRKVGNLETVIGDVQKRLAALEKRVAALEKGEKPSPPGTYSSESR